MARTRINAITHAIEAYERVFEDKERYYSDYSYARFLEETRRNPKAKPPTPDSRYIKTRVQEYYKDRDFSYLVINRRGKVKVKTPRAPSKTKA